jgi:hypothetical protein
MGLDKVQITMIMQFPAIALGNTVQILDPAMLKLSNDQLKLMAKTIGGELIFLKLNVIGTLPKDTRCITRDCYQVTIEASDCCKEHSYYNGIPLYNKEEAPIQKGDSE